MDFNKQKFIALLSDGLNVDQAAEKLGSSRDAAYYHRKHDSAFANEWREAIKNSVKIPDLPADGRWTHVDGQDYVLGNIARGMGFTAPFLVKYRSKRHPLFGHKLTVIEVGFQQRRSNGNVCRQKFDLYLLSELTLLQNAREQAGLTSNARRSGTRTRRARPTIPEVAKSLGITEGAVRHEIRVGNINVAGAEWIPHRVRAEVNGRIVFSTQFKKVQRLHKNGLQRKRLAGFISLPEAARRSGIPLATWHTWTRQEICNLLEAKLVTSSERAFTDHQHYRKMDCIEIADYDLIVKRFKEAKDGRIARLDGMYLSPVTVSQDFALPAENTPPSMILANRRRWNSEELGRPIRSIKAHYLDSGGKLTYGECYQEADVEKLFKRVRWSLSDEQQSLLEAMYQLKAISRETRQPLRAIARPDPRIDPDNYKRDMADLAGKSLILTCTGRSGGAWLTSIGLSLLSKNQ
jgi:hypothetical protein